MRKTSMLMLLGAAAVAVLALPSRAGAAPPSTTRLFATGFGVASVIHHEENGVVTEGYLFGFNVLHGALSDVPYAKAIVFFGTRFDPAVGYPVTFSGAAAASYTANGLAGARLTGTVVAQPFYDGSNLPPDPLPPITIHVDLTFTGTGSTHLDGSHYTSGSRGSVYVAFDATRWRYANVAGAARVDGGAALVDTAQLLGETSGEFNLVAQP
jgi:hypothetical protein